MTSCKHTSMTSITADFAAVGWMLLLFYFLHNHCHVRMMQHVVRD